VQGVLSDFVVCCREIKGKTWGRHQKNLRTPVKNQHLKRKLIRFRIENIEKYHVFYGLVHR